MRAAAVLMLFLAPPGVQAQLERAAAAVAPVFVSVGPAAAGAAISLLPAASALGAPASAPLREGVMSVAPAAVSASEPAEAGLAAAAAASLASSAGSAEALAGALVSGSAGPAFSAAVRAHVARLFPARALRALLGAGYRIETVRRLREVRPELDASHDYLSGWHAHGGPEVRLVLIAEQIKSADGARWEASGSWENAVDHELGLALARVLGDEAAVHAVDVRQAAWYRRAGLTESPQLRDAWRRDYEALPEELKEARDPDGAPNGLHYYLKRDEDGFFHTARRRTFAEGLDVLLRGPNSFYNYADFTRYFPRMLSAMRAELSAHLGWTIAPAAAPPPIRTDPGLTSEELARRLVSGGASPAFVARVRAHLAATLPPALLRELLDGGYRIAADRSVRQNHPQLHADNDYTGGFHARGAKVSDIVVAEKIELLGSERWVDSTVWENAVNHEIGHALAYLLGEAESRADADVTQALWYRKKGLSESPAFRAAWLQDYEAIPGELKKPWRGGLSNPFYYFVHPDAGGWYQRARQETFAEGFDVLLRGPRSTFNHDNFKRYFPRALAEIRRELESRYGPLFAPGR